MQAGRQAGGLASVSWAGAKGRRRWLAAAGKKITKKDVGMINLFDSSVQSLRKFEPMHANISSHYAYLSRQHMSTLANY